MLDNNHFSAIRIRLASPEKILEWSHGEVTKPETINYRSLKPDPDGLFCQKIFGPMKDYECACGKYKKQNYNLHPNAAHLVCSVCGVEITKSSVRREYMGHIHLAAPVVHLWYLRGDCYLKTLLEMDPKDLANIIYYAAYVVVDSGSFGEGNTSVIPSQDGTDAVLSAMPSVRYKEVLSQEAWEKRQTKCREYIKNNPDLNLKMPVVDMGASAIKTLLKNIKIEEERDRISAEIKDPKNAAKRAKLVKRLDVIDSFIRSGNKPEWIVLENLPVIPPDLRPMVQLDGGRFATSDLNDLYRKVITRNNRLKKALEIKAPPIMIRCEMRVVQEAVDALIDNDRRERAPTTGAGHRPLKSLTSLLKGKQGRFRQNLLGKRVDYSGRSVIVVGPELKMYQCGLPKEMALELFRPFVIKQLVASSADKEEKYKLNIKTAKNMIERAQDPAIWEALEKVIKNHPVLLNRAPTLHRLGIQAFEPVLVEGRALKLHPLVCTAYNADFDGDQMAVHVPLSIEAQAEARFLMLASNNILKPQDGAPVVCPTQDMVLGCYYLTSVRPNPKRAEGEIPAFYCEDEAMYAYQMGEITLQEPIKVAIKREIDGEIREKVIDTTVGKLIINHSIPQDLGYVDRSDPDKIFDLEIDKKIGKKDLGKIIDKCYRRHGASETSAVLDEIKAMGFKYSTKGGITVGYKDIIVPDFKYEIVEKAEEEIAEIEQEYAEGMLAAADRKNEIIKVWSDVSKVLDKKVMSSFDEFNPVGMMADSGARGSSKQILQLIGMRGLMNDTAGNTIEVPVKSNFREGLSVLEFFVSSHGARKGLTDTALKTADSGYLTRRLVDVSQDVIISQDDCFTEAGKSIVGSRITPIYGVENKEVASLKSRIIGRYTAETVIDPNTGEVIIGLNERISNSIADKIEAAGTTSVNCRTLLTCQCEHGVCRKCYGDNLATGNEIDIGEAVGIIAAQAIGEPGTQLTMRTFHTGGVAAASDITTGLPRVEEIFEARRPKGAAILAKISGTVRYADKNNDSLVTKIEIIPAEGTASNKDTKYAIPTNCKIRVAEGEFIEAGEPLTEGPWCPSEVLDIMGEKNLQKYLIEEVRQVYSSQGVDLADKHVEIIVRQMMRRVQVESAGDTGLLPGDLVEKYTVNKINEQILEQNKQIYEDWKAARTGELMALGMEYEAAENQVMSEIPDEDLKNPALLREKLRQYVSRKTAELNSQANAEKSAEASENDEQDENSTVILPDVEGIRVPATLIPQVMPITKAALANESFLAAASFQQTTSILTKAAIKGKIDRLRGLKENIIIGKLIPAGIGMDRYRNIDINRTVDAFGENVDVDSDIIGDVDSSLYDADEFDDITVNDESEATIVENN